MKNTSFNPLVAVLIASALSLVSSVGSAQTGCYDTEIVWCVEFHLYDYQSCTQTACVNNMCPEDADEHGPSTTALTGIVAG